MARPKGGPKKRRYQTAFDSTAERAKQSADNQTVVKNDPTGRRVRANSAFTQQQTSTPQTGSPSNANFSSVDGTQQFVPPPDIASAEQNMSADTLFQQATGQMMTPSQTMAQQSVLNYDTNREAQMQAALEQQERLRGIGQFSPEGLGRTSYMFTGIEGVGGFIPNPTVDYFIANVPAGQPGNVAGHSLRDPKTGRFISEQAANTKHLKAQAAQLIQTSRDFWFGKSAENAAKPGAAKTLAKIGAWLATNSFLTFWGRQETTTAAGINANTLRNQGQHEAAQELIDFRGQVLEDRGFWNDVFAVVSGVGAVKSMTEYLEGMRIFHDADSDYQQAYLEDLQASELNYTPAEGTQSLVTPGTSNNSQSVNARAWEIRDERKAQLERETADYASAQWEIAQNNILQLRDELNRAQSAREKSDARSNC